MDKITLWGLVGAALFLALDWSLAAAISATIALISTFKRKAPGATTE